MSGYPAGYGWGAPDPHGEHAQGQPMPGSPTTGGAPMAHGASGQPAGVYGYPVADPGPYGSPSLPGYGPPPVGQRRLETVEVIAPAPSRSRNSLAAFLTLAIAVIALFAVMRFMGEMSRLLASQDRTSAEIVQKMQVTKKGLADLQRKTETVEAMAGNAKTLQTTMAGIDQNMGGMLAGVDSIATQMTAMGTTLEGLDHDVSETMASDDAMLATLKTINSGLQNQAKTVKQMAATEVATSKALAAMPGTLAATNARLRHINGIVCFMGRNGLKSQIEVDAKAFGLGVGSATIDATIVPTGSWC